MRQVREEHAGRPFEPSRDIHMGVAIVWILLGVAVQAGGIVAMWKGPFWDGIAYIVLGMAGNFVVIDRLRRKAQSERSAQR